MKVLYFHQHFSTPKGATGIRSYEMARKLIASGHQVTMVCGSYSGGDTGLDTLFKKGVRRGNVDGIDIVEFNLGYSNIDSFIRRSMIFVSFVLKSVIIVLTEKYDLLFATSTPLTIAIPGIIAKWIRGKRFIFEVRDLWPELPREMGVIKNPLILGAMGMLEWMAYKSANALIGLSPGIRKGIEQLKISKVNIAMIPNGCDLDMFSNQAKEQWQPEGVKDKDFMAVYTGTHGIANGLGSVINVAKILRKRGRNNIKLVLVGQGSQKLALINEAKEESLNNIIFLDPVNKLKLSLLLSRADAGMQLLANVPAFYFGTSPNKFFDYLAAGLPVINNYPGWLAEIINENKCGIVVGPDDPESFANSLITLSEKNQEKIKMGLAARHLAETKFDRQKLADEFVSWLEKWGG